jgi:hypothetical protein
LAKADTGVSRSPAMSNGGFSFHSSTRNCGQQKTHPGGAGDGFWLEDVAAAMRLR